MGLLKWLTGAANRSAKNNNRSAGQQQKKKKKRQQEHKVNTRPSQKSSGGSSDRGRSGGSTKSGGYQPKSYKASQKTQPKQQTKGYTPQVYKASTVKKPSVPSTDVTKQYSSYKSSALAPKQTKPKTYDAVAASRKAFQKGQEARANQAKKGIVGTTANKPKSNVISDLSKPKNYDYKKDLQKAFKKGSETTYLGTKAKTHTTKIDKDTTLKSSDLTRSDFNRMMEASRYGKKKGNILLKGGKRTGQKDIREKVGSKTAESAYKSKAATGVMQGLSKVDVFSGSVGKYNKSAKAAIKKTKESTAYNVGYGIGIAADMGMGGVATRGASAAGLIGKGAAKAAGKGVAKQVPKKALKEATKEAYKVTRKAGAKRFAKNRAGELIAETPTNILDAAKMSLDADGKLDKKEFRKWLAINSGATAGMGGAIEGIGAGMTKKLASNTADLLAKREAGTITAEESKRLTKNIKKLSTKSKGEIDTLSKDIASSRMAEINAKDAAKKAGEYKPVTKKFRGRGNRYTESAEAKARQSRANYAEKLAGNDKRLAERAEARAKAQAAKKYQSGIEATKERAYQKQVEVLGDRYTKLVQRESELMDAVKRENTLEGHARAAAELEQVRTAIKATKTSLDNARANTFSGRVAKNLKEQKRDNTMLGHEKAVREGEALQAEGRARVEKAFKEAEAKYEANPTPENKARMELAEDAVKKAEADAKANVSSEDAPAKNVPTENVDGVEVPTNPKEKTKYEERLQKKVDKRSERIAEIDEELDNIERQLDDLDKEGKRLGGQKKVATDPDRIADLDKGLESVDALREQVNAEKYALRRERKDLEFKNTEANDKISKIEASKGPEEGYAHFPGEEADMVGIKETPEVQKTIKESAEGLDNAPVKQKTADVSKISESGVVDATTKKKKPFSQFYHNVVRTALFDNLDPLEHIANHLPNEQRQAMLAQINEFRRAIKTGRAIVATKGRDIYKKYGLTQRKNREKLADFERYCFLKHDLARVKEGTGFTHLDEKGILEEMADLEKKYSEEKFPVIDEKTGEVIGSELQMYQKDMVGYFRDLLEDEVAAGITSRKMADDFIRRYPDYVPSYREKEFSEILERHTLEEIDVGRGMKAAKGGGDGLVSLYNQMQVKTNTVMKRTQLNKTLQMLCTASGTSEKELDKLVPFFKDMRPEEKAEALMDAQIFPHSMKDGKYKAVMYREGSKIEMNIDKDVYDAIRRWSGDDRKVHVLTTLLNNRVLGGLNSQFKKWITDYNLIFGVKNFARDQATALFYTTDKAGYVRNMMKGIGVCMLPKETLPKSWQIYKDAYQVYKENGGVISQFIARDSASDRLFDTAFKANPFKLVENFNSAMETIPRMTEFISALNSQAKKNAGKNGNVAEEFKNLLGNKDAVSRAMYRAKDVTLNFDRSGWFGSVLNRGPVPFFNPAAQGFDKLGRTLIRDNIKYGENGAIAWTKSSEKGIKSFFEDTTMGSFLKMGTYLTGMVVAPEALWNGLFGDEINGKAKGYEKQSDYNRDTHYLLPIGDGKFFKIPKARELASLQMAIDYVYDNMEYGSGSTWEKLFGDNRVRDLKSMAKLSFEQSGPINPINDSLFAPLWRTKNNETWYGGKIESGADDIRHREEGELWKIWDENTSAVAKAIGKQWNLSPKKVDNVLDSYTGLIYDMGIAQTSAKNSVATTLDKEGKASALIQLTRTPWGNAFIIDSVFQNSNKSDYYDYADRREKKLEGLKEGSKEYMALKAEINKDKTAFSYTSSQYDELQAQIWLNDKMTVAEKRKYCRMLKKGDNLLWNERKDGKKVPSKDPMAVIWNMKDGNGKRIMSTDKIIESCSYTFKNGGNNIKDAWDWYKENGGKSASKFMEVTLNARDMKRAAGDSLSTPRWEEVAYTNQLNHTKGSDKVMAAYIQDDEKRRIHMGNAKLYEQYGGDKRAYYGMKRVTTQEAFNLGYDYPSQMRDGELTMSLANHRTKAGKQYRDLEYQANGHWILDNRMNAGRCLDARLKGKYTNKQLKAFCDKYKLDPSNGHQWTDDDIKKVCDAIDKVYKDDDNELKAAKFVVITGLTWKNPYGEIGDYSIDTDTGVTCVDSYKGYGRRRRRRRRRYGGGGGGGGAKFTPEVNTAGKSGKVTDFSKGSGGSKVKTSGVVTSGRSGSSRASNVSVSDLSRTSKSKVTDVTFKSNLDEAYRKRLKKMREETRPKK